MFQLYRSFMTLILTVFLISSVSSCTSSQEKIEEKRRILKKMPENSSLHYSEVVFVENDGRCEEGLVIKVTGGKKSAGIRRKYECVKHP